MLYIVKLRKQWKDGKSYSLRIFCLGPTRKKLSFWHESFICHLHIPQNTPCLPPELLVFYSSWVFKWSKGKLKTILMQNFGGQTRCIMGGMHTVNWRRWFDQDGWIMALFFFVFLLTLTFIWSIKMQIKRTLANIQPSWPHDWSVRPSWKIIIIQVNHSCSTVDSDVLRCTMVYMYIACHGKYIVVIMH